MDWNSLGVSLKLGKCVVDGVPTLQCVPVVFAILINTLLALVGTVSVLVMIFSGIKMITARGDAKELDNAHKTFFYSIIGLLIVLFSFLLVNIISYITGVKCINQFGFDSCTTIPANSSSGGGGGGGGGKR